MRILFLKNKYLRDKKVISFAIKKNKYKLLQQSKYY